MNCECGYETKVVDSRQKAVGTVYRRRRCLGCGNKFSTYEVLAEDLEAFETAAESAKAVVQVAGSAFAGLPQSVVGERVRQIVRNKRQRKAGAL